MRGEKNKHLGLDDDLGVLLEDGGYILYSDDALFRIYADMDQGSALCTLDLLEIAEGLKIVSPFRVAKVIGQLCAWNVGVVVTDENLIAVIPDEVGSAKSVRQAIDAIHNDTCAAALFEGVWNIRKSYIEIHEHLSVFLNNLLSNPNNSIRTISSIVGVWYSSARLRIDIGDISPLRRLAYLIVLAVAQKKEKCDGIARRAIKVYLDIVEVEWGTKMDEHREREALRHLGMTVAEVDYKKGSEGRIWSRFEADLIHGTAEKEYFSKAYSSKLQELMLSRESM